MCPFQRRDLRQKLRRAISTFVQSCCDCASEMIRIPIDDDCGQQVQTCHAVMLTFSSAVADFTLPADAQSVFEGVMRLAFVQADLGTALHVGVQQPFNNEQGALDATDLPQRHCKFMLARV